MWLLDMRHRVPIIMHIHDTDSRVLRLVRYYTKTVVFKYRLETSYEAMALVRSWNAEGIAVDTYL
jgi:hypothetical protein